MKERQAKANINKRDICLFALVDVGGDVEFVSTEEVAVRAFEIYPERFGLIKYQQFPDVDSVRVTLSDLRKPKYKSLVEGGQRSGWRATKGGARWERAHRKAVIGAMKNKLSGERRISSGHLMTTEKVRSARLNRIVRSEAFAKWKKGVRPSVYDFYDLLRIDNYTPENVYREHLRALLEVVPEDSQEKRFLAKLARIYGRSYREDV